MSGHSKWNTIKRKKGANDAARAKEFTKVARIITVAAQNGGGDPSMNPALSFAIDKARSINMPNDNIQRAIKRGTGEGSGGGRIEEVTYEAYGPANTALLIDCATDNKNRTVGEVRSLVEKIGGRFADSGSVSWQFTTLGNILLEFETPEEKNERAKQKWGQKESLRKISAEESENIQLELMEVNGIIDIIADNIGIQIKTDYAELNNVKKFLENKGYKISEAGLIKESNSLVDLDADSQTKVQEFIEKIEELDDVQNVWTNVK